MKVDCCRLVARGTVARALAMRAALAGRSKQDRSRSLQCRNSICGSWGPCCCDDRQSRLGVHCASRHEHKSPRKWREQCQMEEELRRPQLEFSLIGLRFKQIDSPANSSAWV